MQVYMDRDDMMSEELENLASIEIYTNGQKDKLAETDKRFVEIKNRLTELFSKARVMPAFGVSFHKQTCEAMEQGIWLKLNFNKQQVKNGLPFDALLFKLDEVYGFNLIREYEGKFEGRCIYLDFDEQIDLNNLIKI